jgi:hypothetical protein
MGNLILEITGSTEPSIVFSNRKSVSACMKRITFLLSTNIGKLGRTQKNMQ